VGVRSKINENSAKQLLAKAEKMAIHMRDAFLDMDTSGDARLEPSETLEMFKNSEAGLNSVSIQNTCTLLGEIILFLPLNSRF